MVGLFKPTTMKWTVRYDGIQATIEADSIQEAITKANKELNKTDDKIVSIFQEKHSDEINAVISFDLNDPDDIQRWQYYRQAMELGFFAFDVRSRLMKETRWWLDANEEKDAFAMRDFLFEKLDEYADSAGIDTESL